MPLNCRLDLKAWPEPLSWSHTEKMKFESPKSGYRVATMELRNHPIMFCDGVRTWPPKWLQTHGPIIRSVAGEVGILDGVFLSSVMPPDRLYLVITTEEGNGYFASVIFEESQAAKKMFEILLAHTKEPISAIGSIDIPIDL